MSTQYDAIGLSYEGMSKLRAARLQDHNFQAVVAPYACGASVLDLACGTGRYSRVLLGLGAARVVGVDISPVMIQAARDTSSRSEKLSFHVGDCSKPVVFEGGPFDLVLGVWLLNYAANRGEMTEMFRNIALNLKSGGRFIGVMPFPTDDPKTHVQELAATIPEPQGNITPTIKREVEDGVEVHIFAGTEAGNVEFDNYHLAKGVYEQSATDGGLYGELTWSPLVLPEGDTAKDWGRFWEYPHFGVLEVAQAVRASGEATLPGRGY